jgi:hypothetical protein
LNILETALQLTAEDRQAIYGHPVDNWERTAEIASALLGTPISAHQCVLVAFAMKFARLRQTPAHQDTMVDIAGYAWVLDKVHRPAPDKAPNPKKGRE